MLFRSGEMEPIHSAAAVGMTRGPAGAGLRMTIGFCAAQVDQGISAGSVILRSRATKDPKRLR